MLKCPSASYWTQTCPKCIHRSGCLFVYVCVWMKHEWLIKKALYKYSPFNGWRQSGGRRAGLPSWLFTLKQASCGFKFVITVLPFRVCQKCTTKVTQYISWPRGHHLGSWLLHVTRTEIGRGYVSSFKYFYIYLNILLVKTWWKICLFLQRSLSWQLKGSARWRPWRLTSSFSWLTCRSLVGKMIIWKRTS